jgi:hypothetical protein
MLTRKPKIITAELQQINLHGSVPPDTRELLATIEHTVIGEASLTYDGIINFITLHPLHVIKNKEGQFFCFAGLRSFQLAKAHLDPDQEVRVLLYPKTNAQEIESISHTDIYISYLAFAMEKRFWAEDMARLWKATPRALIDQLTPELKNKTKLAKALGINRRKISTT